MKAEFNEQRLLQKNACFTGSGGVSKGNRSYGFRPAFRDNSTGAVYLSCFSNGMTAPVHLLDGLPDEVILERSFSGKVCAVKDSLISGFLFSGKFFTREEAANAIASD